MAAMTTARAGDWKNVTGGVTPWTALTGAGTGGVPGVGDTVTLSHAVTVDDTQVVGTSPATSTAVVTINNNGTSTSGRLTILGGGTLSVRGQITTNGSSGGIAYIQVNAGGELKFDSSQATAQVRYQLRLVGADDYITLVGTSASNRALLTNLSTTQPNNANAATLGAQINGPSFSGTIKNRIVSRFGTITFFGGATTSYASYGATFPDFEDTILDTCGTFYSVGTYYGDSVVRFDRCKFTGSPAANILLKTNVANTTGTRLVRDCVFDNAVGWSVSDVTCSGCIITGYPANAGTIQTTGLGLAITDSMYVLPGQTSGGAGTTGYNNCVILGVNQSTNARSFATGSDYGDYDASTPVFDQLIWDYPNCSSVSHANLTITSGDSGDQIQTPSTNPSTAITTTLARSIAVPISSGHAADSYAARGIYPGTMFTGRGNANTIMQAWGNTWHCYDGSATRGSHGGINVAESTTSPVGAVPLFRDNLCWSKSGVTSGVPLTLDTSATTNGVTPSNCHHNASWNLITHSQSGSSNGTHYYGVTSGTIGTGDITNTDPQFVDSDRCFVKWVRTLRGDLGSGSSDGAGSYTGATYTDDQTITFGLAEMRKKLDSDFDSRYTIAAYQTYIRAGFAPTNPTYRNSNAAGTASIGAVDGVFGGVPHYLESSLSGGFQTMGF